MQETPETPVKAEEDALEETPQKKQQRQIADIVPPVIILTCKCKIPDLDLTATDHGTDVMQTEYHIEQVHSSLGSNTHVAKSSLDVWGDEVCAQLGRRGFKIEERLHDGDSHSFLLTVKDRLYKRLSEMHNGGDASNYHQFAYRLKLAQDSLEIIKRLTEANFDFHTHDLLLNHHETLKTNWEVWIGHNKKVLKENKMKTPTDIREYYGDKIAMYFAFLDYYTFSLGLLSIVGALIFYDLYTITKDNPISVYDFPGFFDRVDVNSVYLPWMALIQSLWSSLFLAFWRKRESAYLLDWGDSHEFDASVTTSGNAGDSGSVQRRGKTVVSYSISLTFLLFCLGLMFYTSHIEEQFKLQDEYLLYGFSVPFFKSIPSFCQVLIPMIFERLGSKIFHFCTELEKNSQAYHESSLIVKKFLFQFVTNYSVPLYIALIKRDLVELRWKVFYLLSVSAALNNLQEFFSSRIPILKAKFWEKKKYNKFNDVQKFLEEEIDLDEANIDDEFLEMAIQFGFVSMFSVAFPLAPVFAFGNNMFEGMVDLNKLSASRRYGKQVNRSRIGVWQNIFESLGFLSVLVNGYLICFGCSNFSVLIPDQVLGFHVQKEFWESLAGRVILLAGLEHFVVGLKGLVSYIFASDDQLPPPARPLSINPAMRGGRVPATPESLTSSHTPNFRESASSNTPMSANSRQPAATPNVVRKKKGDIKSEIVGGGQNVNPVFSDPMLFLMAFCIAPLLHLLRISIWWYLPIIIVITVYFNIAKDQDIRRKGLALSVSDDVIKFLLKGNLPSWVESSNNQRVMWLNDALEKLWPYLGAALGNMIIAIVNPILKDVCEGLKSILSALFIEVLSFGNVSPTINSILLHRTHEAIIRLDLDITWASKIFAVLKVRLRGTPLPLTVELSNISLKCVFRLELKDFTSDGLACFKVLTIGFKEEPQLDFSLKLASLNVGNLGVSKHLNVTAIIEDLIRGILKSLLVYPNHIPIPMYPDAQTNLTCAPPLGLLVVKIICAQDLKSADMNGKSDPYVVVNLSTGSKPQQTRVVSADLNPTWDEQKNLILFSMEDEFLELEVKDYDRFTSHNTLGFCCIDVKKALEYEPDSMPMLDLFETKTCGRDPFACTQHRSEEECNFKKKGRIKISAEYIALASSEDEDIALGDNEVLAQNISNSRNDIIMESHKVDGRGSFVTNNLPYLGEIKGARVGLLTITTIICRNFNHKKKSGMMGSSDKERSLRATVELVFSNKTSVEGESQLNTTNVATAGSDADFDCHFNLIVQNLIFADRDGVKKDPMVEFWEYDHLERRNKIRQTAVTLLITIYDDRASNFTRKQKKLGTRRIRLADIVNSDESFISVDLPLEEVKDYELKDNGAGTDSRQVGLKVEWRLTKAKQD